MTSDHADQPRPLASYGAITAVFNLLLGGFLLAAARRGRLPERWRAGDLVLLGAATTKLSRLIAKDRVTAVIRAPFTRFQEDIGHGQVAEAARGRGMQRAIGELLVCEYCLAQWVAAAFVAALTVAPRTTRAVAAVFTVFGISDVLQLAHSRLEQSA